MFYGEYRLEIWRILCRKTDASKPHARVSGIALRQGFRILKAKCYACREKYKIHLPLWLPTYKLGNVASSFLCPLQDIARSIKKALCIGGIGLPVVS